MISAKSPTTSDLNRSTKSTLNESNHFIYSIGIFSSFPSRELPQAICLNDLSNALSSSAKSAALIPPHWLAFSMHFWGALKAFLSLSQSSPLSQRRLVHRYHEPSFDYYHHRQYSPVIRLILTESNQMDHSEATNMSRFLLHPPLNRWYCHSLMMKQ